MSKTETPEQSHQKYLVKLARTKKKEEALSRDVSEKALHKFTRCATDHGHEMIVCIWCDAEHDNPWCADCHPRRCPHCDKCKSCDMEISNCLCGNFPNA